MKISKLEQDALDRIREINQRGLLAGGIPCPDKKGKLSRDDARTAKLMDLGLIFYVGQGKRTERGHEGGRGMLLAELFDETKYEKLCIYANPEVRVWPFKGLTVRQAIKYFPDLLDEPLIGGSTDHDNLEEATKVTFQFYGDGQYRTKDLYKKKS